MTSQILEGIFFFFSGLVKSKACYSKGGLLDQLLYPHDLNPLPVKLPDVAGLSASVALKSELRQVADTRLIEIRRQRADMVSSKKFNKDSNESAAS